MAYDGGLCANPYSQGLMELGLGLGFQGLLMVLVMDPRSTRLEGRNVQTISQD